MSVHWGKAIFLALVLGPWDYFLWVTWNVALIPVAFVVALFK